MFLAATAACPAPGLAALCAPESAISPTAYKCGYWGSLNCSVGRTRMKLFVGLTIESGEEDPQVAEKCVIRCLPSGQNCKVCQHILAIFKFHFKRIPVVREPIIKDNNTCASNQTIRTVRNYQGMLSVCNTYFTPSSAKRSLIILLSFSW